MISSPVGTHQKVYCGPSAKQLRKHTSKMPSRHEKTSSHPSLSIVPTQHTIEEVPTAEQVRQPLFKQDSLAARAKKTFLDAHPD